MFREQQLRQLMRLYEEHGNEMADALMADLRKHKQEAYLLEIEFLKGDLQNLIDNLKNWTKPEEVCIIVMQCDLKYVLIVLNFFQPKKTFVNMMDGVYIYKDPYGVALIMGAWNYPLQLTLLPVAAAIAAGNCVIIKPSECAENCAKFIADFIPKYLDNVRE